MNIRYLFFIASLALLVAVLGWFWQDSNQEWGKYQKEYYTRELAKAMTAVARKSITPKIEIKQIVLRELNRVDRCITCHVPVDDASYSGMPPPLSYHPDHDQHPFARFGGHQCRGARAA